jgi:hypothetical protein
MRISVQAAVTLPRVPRDINLNTILLTFDRMRENSLKENGIGEIEIMK